MITVTQVLIEQKCIDFLDSRNLRKQYLKAQSKLLTGDLKSIKFKKRKPKTANIYYFRINKQYRALGVFKDTGTLYVYEIDDHQ